MEADTRTKEVEEAALQNQRASAAAASATSVVELLRNDDVINLFCAEDQAELNNLKRRLRELQKAHDQTKRDNQLLGARVAELEKIVHKRDITINLLRGKIQRIERLHEQVLPPPSA